MIENGERQMWLALPIGLDQQITAPHSIAGHGSGHTMFQFSPHFIDPLLMLPTGVCDVGLAQSHVSPGVPAPIEVTGDRSAPRLWHERLQSNDFVPDPFIWVWDGQRPGGVASPECDWPRRTRDGRELAVRPRQSMLDDTHAAKKQPAKKC